MPIANVVPEPTTFIGMAGLPRAPDHEQQAVELLRSELARGAVAHLTVRGGSMAPALRDGETVQVTSAARHGGLRPGAVVVAMSRTGGLVCHRILARDRGGKLWIAGDATREVEPIGAGDLVAVVDRGGGRLGAASLRARLRWLVYSVRQQGQKVLRALAAAARFRNEWRRVTRSQI